MIRDQLLNILLAARDTVRVQIWRIAFSGSDNFPHLTNPDSLFIDIRHVLPRTPSERRAKAQGRSA
jgi:hypothetical protein